MKSRDSTLLPTPVRCMPTDDPGDIIHFAIGAFANGGVALATLVEIRGGSARKLGSQVAISADGRFCGYVSGGCVEAAIAFEALLAMADGKDRTVLFGDGSPFFDIALPCGGGITVAIHVLKSVSALESVLRRLAQRETAALRYCLTQQSIKATLPRPRSCWIDGDFLTVYQPPTRVIVSGSTAEAQAVIAIAGVTRYDVVLWQSNSSCDCILGAIDPYTAVLLLHHDLDGESYVLKAALSSDAFYIGALGSTRTHGRRIERLRNAGWSKQDLDRIKAPIGIFGPVRDAMSLGLSVLADVAASRHTVHG